MCSPVCVQRAARIAHEGILEALARCRVCRPGHLRRLGSLEHVELERPGLQQEAEGAEGAEGARRQGHHRAAESRFEVPARPDEWSVRHERMAAWRTKCPAVTAGSRASAPRCARAIDGPRRTPVARRPRSGCAGFRCRALGASGSPSAQGSPSARARSSTGRSDLAVVRVRNAVTLVTVATFGGTAGENLNDLSRISTKRGGWS